MAITKADIKRWIKENSNCRWLIVACDTFDYGDYPIGFMEDKKDDCINKIKSLQKGENMQTLMEVYDLKKPIEPQLDVRRAMEIPV
jgi:hypothetical protein